MVQEFQNEVRETHFCDSITSKWVIKNNQWLLIHKYTSCFVKEKFDQGPFACQ